MKTSTSTNRIDETLLRAASLAGAVALGAGTASAQTLIDDAGTSRDGNVGAYSSLVAAGNELAVAYSCIEDFSPPTTYDLRFAWRTGESWQWTTVDNGPATSGALARASDGVYHVIYHNQGLSWAYGSASAWTLVPERIDPTTTGGEISMALDSADRPHVTFLEPATANQWYIRYTRWTGTEWQRMPGNLLASQLNGSSSHYLGLDSLDRPHVVYAMTTGGVRHALFRNNGWYVDSIGGSALATVPALAIDSGDGLHVAWCTQAGLMYAHKAAGGGWILQTVLAGDPYVASSIAITVDSQHRPAISFVTKAASDICLAVRPGDKWTTARLDGDGLPGGDLELGRSGTSIAFDADGYAHVTYQAVTTYDDGTRRRADLRIASIQPYCRGDFNGDLLTDFFDYLDFVAAFDAEDPVADFNHDGTVDFFDYLDFVVAFDAGCE
jgi:hypothetical protein